MSRRPRPAPSLVEAMADALEATMTRSTLGLRHLPECQSGLWLRGQRPCGCSARCQEARALLSRARADAVVQLELTG